MDPDELIENPNGGLMSDEQVFDLLDAEGIADHIERWREEEPDEVLDERGDDGDEFAYGRVPDDFSPDEHLDREFEDRISGYDHEQGD